MKKVNHLIGTLSLALMAVMFLNSCGTVSVTQRKYNKGFHVEWAGKSKAKGQEVVVAKKSKSPATCETETTVAVIEQETEVAETEKAELTFENTQEKVERKEKFSKSLKKAKTEDIGIADNDVVAAQSFSKKTFLKAVAAKRNSSDLGTLLLVIIAIIIPPLAVYLYEGSWTSRVTLNLILTLGALLIGGVLIIGSLWFSLYIIPIIHALIVILS